MDRSVTLSVHTASWKGKKRAHVSALAAAGPLGGDRASSLPTRPPHRLMLNWRKYLVPFEVKLGPFISDPTDPSSVKSKVRVLLPTVCVK